MTTDLITVRPDASLPEAARFFRSHAIKSLHVVGNDTQLRGLVLQADLLDVVAAQDRPLARKQQFSRRTVSDAMRPADRAVSHDMPVGALLNRLAAQGSEVGITRSGQLSSPLVNVPAWPLSRKGRSLKVL